MSSKFGNMMFGLIVGGLAGYAYAMLNAPRPGTETREMLNMKSREIRDRAMDTFYDTKDKANKVVKTGREKVEDTLSQTKATASGAVGQVQEKGTDFVTQKRVEVSEGLRKAADSIEPDSDVAGGMRNTPSI